MDPTAFETEITKVKEFAGTAAKFSRIAQEASIDVSISYSTMESLDTLCPKHLDSLQNIGESKFKVQRFAKNAKNYAEETANLLIQTTDAAFEGLSYVVEMNVKESMLKSDFADYESSCAVMESIWAKREMTVGVSKYSVDLIERLSTTAANQVCGISASLLTVRTQSRVILAIVPGDTMSSYVRDKIEILIDLEIEMIDVQRDIIHAEYEVRSSFRSMIQARKDLEFDVFDEIASFIEGEKHSVETSLSIMTRAVSLSDSISTEITNITRWAIDAKEAEMKSEEVLSRKKQYVQKKVISKQNLRTMTTIKQKIKCIISPSIIVAIPMSHILDNIENSEFLTCEDIYVLSFVSKDIHEKFNGFLPGNSMSKVNAIVENKNLCDDFKNYISIETAIYASAKFNEPDILEKIWKINYKIILQQKFTNIAASEGSCDVLEWAYRHKVCESFRSLQINAAENGRYEVFYWFQEKDIRFSEGAYISAAKKGKGILLLHLLSMENFENVEILKDIAIKNGHIETVRLLENF
jgi:hypothetical protein